MTPNAVRTGGHLKSPHNVWKKVSMITKPLPRRLNYLGLGGHRGEASSDYDDLDIGVLSDFSV